MYGMGVQDIHGWYLWEWVGEKSGVGGRELNMG